jgi:hypothetical protein
MKTNRFIAAAAALLCAVGAFSCTKRTDENSKKQEDTTAAQTEEVTSEAETTTEQAASSGSDEETDINDYISVTDATPAMWKVTDPATGNELYMMGTMHIITDDTFPLPDYIMDVYEKCDGIAVEVDINSIMDDMEQLRDFYSKMLYTDGTTVKDHLSEETYKKMRDYLSSKGMYSPMMESYMAGFWATQVETASVLSIDNMDQNGVDAKFIDMANKDGKKVISIETIDAQATAITALSDELSDYMISSTIEKTEDMSEYTKSFAELYDAWASGDIDKLDEEDEDSEDIPEELEDDMEAYMNSMLYDRNAGMAEKAEEYLKNGDKYFFMVGGAHFAGEKGVDDILIEKGYKVERVAA